MKECVYILGDHLYLNEAKFDELPKLFYNQTIKLCCKLLDILDSTAQPGIQQIRGKAFLTVL